MDEILKFEYDSAGPSIRASVPVMREGVRVIGVVEPELTITLSDLADEGDEEALLAADLTTWLARALPIVRKLATRPVADPDAIQAKANANAREAERLRLEREAAEKLRADAEAAANTAEEKRKAAEAESLKLDARIQAKRAELAEVEATAAEAVAPKEVPAAAPAETEK